MPEKEHSYPNWAKTIKNIEFDFFSEFINEYIVLKNKSEKVRI